jgi:hypothetical protein|tara:strand:+ start:858 stop:1049 length:192 start_codon:yes stop_codon:yes gene_type:complete
MKEINEIRSFLYLKITRIEADQELFGQDNVKEIKELRKQLDNANKVKAKLQGAIDLFKEIEEL